MKPSVRVFDLKACDWVELELPEHASSVRIQVQPGIQVSVWNTRVGMRKGTLVRADTVNGEAMRIRTVDLQLNGLQVSAAFVPDDLE